MDKKTKELCDELCALTKHKTWRKDAFRCTGKWSGTIDYYLVFEDGSRIFISNGMTYFAQSLREKIESLKKFSNESYRNEILAVLKRQQDIDNATAEKLGLKKYKVVDVVLAPVDCYIDAYYLAKISVEGKNLLVCESGYRCFMNDSVEELENHFNGKNKRKLFTAAGIENPDFVLANVLHSSTSEMYVKSV